MIYHCSTCHDPTGCVRCPEAEAVEAAVRGRSSRARYRRAVEDFIAECDRRAAEIGAVLGIYKKAGGSRDPTVRRMRREAIHNAAMRRKASARARAILTRLEAT